MMWAVLASIVDIFLAQADQEPVIYGPTWLIQKIIKYFR